MKFIIYYSLILLFFSCKKFVTVDPPTTQLVTATVFTNDSDAVAALNGIYSTMMSSVTMASANTTLYAGLSADELTNYSTTPDLSEFYENSLLKGNSNILGYWSDAYKFIYAANAAIEGLSTSQGVDSLVKKQLLGEAELVRAYCYFYLVNLFGDVPLVLSTDYQVNATIARSASQSVYGQIVTDLQNAGNQLQVDYSFSGGSRTRPSKWAANALLARVCLYQKNWPLAITLSSGIINNSGLFSLQPVCDNVFLANSSEAVWQLAPVVPLENTQEANIFILTGAPQIAVLSNYVLNAFEPGDERRASWVDSLTLSGATYYYPFKYKVNNGNYPVSEYYMILRLAEQYLIRAEAEANSGDSTDAVTDLDMIRNRAGLQNYNAAQQGPLLSAILHERQVELFAEWGHRWLDLKRTGMADGVLGLIKTGWNSADTLYPIPQSEIINDPNITQNPNY